MEGSRDLHVDEAFPALSHSHTVNEQHLSSNVWSSSGTKRLLEGMSCIEQTQSISPSEQFLAEPFPQLTAGISLHPFTSAARQSWVNFRDFENDIRVGGSGSLKDAVNEASIQSTKASKKKRWQRLDL